MYFTKNPHPANFVFATAYDPKTGKVECGKGGPALEAEISAFAGDVYHVRATRIDRPSPDLKLVSLTPPERIEGLGRLRVSKKCELELLGKGNKPLLRSVPAEAFGVSGGATMFQFENPRQARYFGLGEKTFGRLDVKGLRTKFWNTDVWADFHFAQWLEHAADPYYLSVPYVIVRIGQEYVGLLIENPCAPWIETGARTTIPTKYVEPEPLILGAEDGPASLWILYGPSLPELTCKLQKLVGVTPLPPIWALGYHQSRWGYGGAADLVELDRQFSKHEIPVDGLWLDIDYMDGYRVFTYDDDRFPDGPSAAVAAVEANGRVVVPILDPGVKREPGYSVYDDGRKKGVFCRNAEGNEFVGMVWPGRTVFPDFSSENARTWWAGYAKAFRKLGFIGAWVDMNDPSTGSVDPQGMLFQDGKLPHLSFHNQYALGMQMATREGFLAAEPDRRPFLLTRSGWIGTSRYSAVWTGDNVSNRFYLRGCIPTTLSLSLSGIPFNGPDVGGFGGDADEALMLDWIKCCFLFPFMRNHSSLGTREQEPWRYSAKALRTIRRYIRLRYKLLPYLYNLFVEQEIEGHPILRPLMYHFSDPKATHDQFLVGPSLLQAPFLDEPLPGDEATTRTLLLPGKEPWFDLCSGKWIEPGSHEVTAREDWTPLYARHGAIIPTLVGERKTNEKPLDEVEFHVFMRHGKTSYVYTYDDGDSLAYKQGKRSRFEIGVEKNGNRVDLTTRVLACDYRPLKYKVFLYGDVDKMSLDGVELKPSRAKTSWSGQALDVRVISPPLP